MKKIVTVMFVLMCATFYSTPLVNADVNKTVNTVVSYDQAGLKDTSLDSVINSKEELVFIGKASCPDCRRVQPLVDGYLKKHGLVMNYLDVDKYLNNPQIFDYFDQINLQYVPSLLLVKNGKAQVLDIDQSNYENVLAQSYSAKDGEPIEK